MDGFLKFNDYEVLKDAGRISTEMLKELAEGKQQDKNYESDFDKAIKKYIGKKKN